jgi:ATP-dependent Lhr-like helicase
LAATGLLPDDRTILVEHFRDETGNQQMMVHSVFGKQINSPLAILTMEAAKSRIHANISYVEDDDGFLLFPYGDEAIPEGLLLELTAEQARPILEAVLPVTPVFNMNFRYNAAHALMMGVRKAGRQPLWVQRMRSAEMLDSLMKYERHPLIRETKRECLEDYWDLPGLEYVLSQIRSGSIRICEMHLDTPSPMSFLLRQQTEAANMYDYSPTPMGIHHATEEALKDAKLITPEPEQLAKVFIRARLPEDEKQLHSLLMIEGDLVAGELEVPIEWLETLAGAGQANYIEPGLWIAAEHSEKYSSALADDNPEAGNNGRQQDRSPYVKQILLRLLRYRGAQTAEMISERYLWREEYARELLQELSDEGEAIESDGLFYHSQMYDRARKETIKSRRAQIRTQPPQHYASLLADRLYIAAAPAGQLEAVLKRYSDLVYPVSVWESILLPARVSKYRPELLDTVLAGGNLFWQLHAEEGISFHLYEDIDWEAQTIAEETGLEGKELLLYEALLKRGASFMQRLSGLIEGESPYDLLLSLAEKGYVCADSFAPIRHREIREKLNKATLKQRVSAKAKVMSTGRWEITRPRRELSTEEQLERIFDRVIILSRETVQGISWPRALETLRIWEYTGRVRRGYFIEGLSGVQFIRDKEFSAVMSALELPKEDIVWLSALDPAQPWGKCLSHKPGRAFMNLPGTAVAMRAGLPVAVLERQGKLLRVFEEEYLLQAMRAFALEYSRRRIFTAQNRLLIREYPPEAVGALTEAGFKRELQDYVLYRI